MHAAVEAAELALIEFSNLKRGVLSVQASQTIANYWLPRHLAAFRSAYPQVEIRASIGNTVMTCLSFFGLRLGLAGGCVLLSSSRNPTLQPVEVDINDGCRIESQQLAEKESADDGQAKRTAKFRANPAAQHQRQSAQHCGHGRH